MYCERGPLPLAAPADNEDILPRHPIGVHHACRVHHCRATMAYRTIGQDGGCPAIDVSCGSINPPASLRRTCVVRELGVDRSRSADVGASPKGWRRRVCAGRGGGNSAKDCWALRPLAAVRASLSRGELNARTGLCSRLDLGK